MLLEQPIDRNPNNILLRRWSYHSKEIHLNILKALRFYGATPQTHKNVLDLCSGDGSIAAILIQNGWDVHNVVCADRYASPKPLREVQDASWLYFDVGDLFWTLKKEGSIAQALLDIRNTFDIVTIFMSPFSPQIKQEVCNFFVRPGGVVLCP